MGAQAYALFVSTAPNKNDVFSLSWTQATNANVPGLLKGTKYYVRLATKKNGVWQSVYSTFVAGSGMADLTSPPDHAFDVDPQAPFTWTPFPNGDAYRLQVGTSTGGTDVYDSGPITATSQTVPGLVTGATYNVRLQTEVAGQWLYQDSQFTVGTTLAHMIYPTDKAVGVDGSEPFRWSSVSDAEAYYLWVGSAPRLHDIALSGPIQSTSMVVQGVVPGNTYYVSLFTEKGGKWIRVESTFQAGDPNLASLIYPQPNQTDVDPFGTISWTAIPDAEMYSLYIGTKIGGRDVFTSVAMTSTQVMPTGLAYGRQYYARLFTRKYGVWLHRDVAFRTMPQSSVSNLADVKSRFYDQVRSLTASVRMMATLPDNVAIAGTPLADWLIFRGVRDHAACMDFSHVLYNLLQAHNISARERSLSLT
jgi:hypothetical protein